MEHYHNIINKGHYQVNLHCVNTYELVCVNLPPNKLLIPTCICVNLFVTVIGLIV